MKRKPSNVHIIFFDRNASTSRQTIIAFHEDNSFSFHDDDDDGSGGCGFDGCDGVYDDDVSSDDQIECSTVI